MKTFLKTLLLAVMAAMLLSFACIGAAADGADAEYPAAVPITYDGMSARVKTDAPGLRSMYHVDLAAVKAWEDAGYTVEYGAIMAGEKKKIADEVSNTPDQLRVVKDAETGKYTAYVVDGAQKAQPVCVYSSAETSYASGIFTYKNETEAGFAFTGVFRYEQQNSVYYSFGFIYAGFFYAEKEGEEPIVEYIVPETTESEFFADNKCTLLEVSTYWAEQPGAYATNKNILNVIRSQMQTVYTEPYSAEEPLSLEANAKHEMTLSNMKAGIYAVKVKATGSTGSYGLVYYANGGVGRQYMKKMTDGTSAWQYIYLNEGDNTVSIKPAGAITVENIEISLAEEILPENMESYFSFRVSKNDETFEDRVTAGAEHVPNPDGTGAYFYDGDSGRSITIKFDGIKADKYRVYAIAHTGAANTSVNVAVSETESSKKVPYSKTGDGSSGAGGNYIDFGVYEFAEGTNHVSFAASGSYVNIGTVFLVRETHTVTIQNFDGKILSKQEVYTGEYATSTNVISVPDGYELVDKVAFSSLPITEDTVIYPNARRTDALSATIDGTTLTVEGATEGYYDLDINVTADFASGNYLWVEANGTVYGDRCLTYEEGHTETISMAVYLKGGKNTLTVRSHDGKTIKNIVVNSATFTNVQHTYNAVRVLGKDFTEDSVFNKTDRGNVHHRLGLGANDTAIYSSVSFPSSGYYLFYSAGRTEEGTVKLTVGETEKVLSLGATVGNATHYTKLLPISDNLVYVEAGTYDIMLSEHNKTLLGMDALVFAPHLTCTPEDEYTVDVEPACNKDGSKSKHCTVCGEIIKKTVTSIPADNDLHVGEWEFIEGTKHGAAKVNCTVCEKTVVKEFVDPYSQKANVTVGKITGSGTAEATFTVTTNVTGWYEVEILGHAKTGKYFTLYNKTLNDANVYTYQKDTNASTKGFGIYLIAGVDNEIVYKKNDTNVTITGVNFTLIAAHEIADYATISGGKYDPGANVTTEKEIGNISIDKGGYYYIGITSAVVSAGTVTITLTAGENAVPLEKAVTTGNVLLYTEGSTDTLNYDEFGFVYLAAGEYTVKVGITSHYHIGTVFAYPVDTVDHVCSEFKEVETVAPTCSTEGEMTEACVLCGAANATRPIPTTDHTGEWVVAKEMTKTENGLMSQTCTVCGTVSYKDMKNPYIQKANVKVGEVSGNKVTVRTDVSGWYEVNIIAETYNHTYYKLYNETLNNANIYTYQYADNVGKDGKGFGVYLIAGEDNVLNYNGSWTGIRVKLIAAHAYEDYATVSGAVKDYSAGNADVGVISIGKDGYYYIGMTSGAVANGTVTFTFTEGDNTPVTLSKAVTTTDPLLVINGSTDALNYDEFGVIYLTAGDYHVNVAVTAHYHIGTVFAYPVETPDHICTDIEVVTNISATCKDTGIETYTCRACGKVDEVVTEATGVHEGDWVITQPTSSSEGLAEKNCVGCGISLETSKVLAPLTDVTGATPITVEATGESKAYTFTVTVEKTGFYRAKVEGVGTDASNYWYLSANGYRSRSKEVSNAFVVYLVAGESNTVTYSGPYATSATFTLVTEVEGEMASVTGVGKPNYEFAVGTSDTNNAHLGTSADMGVITINESGFYRLVGISKASINEATADVTLTFTDAEGKENVIVIKAHKTAVVNPNGSTATGYDAFGVVYLEKGTYTLNVETHSVLFNCSTLFAIPVEATDVVPAE